MKVGVFLRGTISITALSFAALGNPLTESDTSSPGLLPEWNPDDPLNRPITAVTDGSDELWIDQFTDMALEEALGEAAAGPVGWAWLAFDQLTDSETAQADLDEVKPPPASDDPSGQDSPASEGTDPDLQDPQQSENGPIPDLEVEPIPAPDPNLPPIVVEPYPGDGDDGDDGDDDG